MHIAIVGPIATADISSLLEGDLSQLPPGYSGAPLLKTLIAEFLRQGHRVTAITLSVGMELAWRRQAHAHGPNLDLIFVPMRRRAWRPNGWQTGRIVDLYGFERRGLRHAIVQATPDVVHAHWSYEFALAALASGLPHVVTCHDSPSAVARFYRRDRLSRSLYRRLREFMAIKVLRQARYVTAVSPYMRDEVQSITQVPVRIVPNPVDPLAIDIGAHRHAPVGPRFAMVCNGWDARKNPQPALQAFAKLRRVSQKAELHLFGHDFGHGQRGYAWARQAGLADGMVFHGAVTHRQLLQALSESDVLLHPALEESFGMVVAEAMAIGLPVVAGESSGAVPWVLGDGKGLCDVRSENAIFEAIERVLDTDTYAAQSRAGRARVVETFGPEAVATAYLQSYKAAIGERISC